MRFTNSLTITTDKSDSRARTYRAMLELEKHVLEEFPDVAVMSSSFEQGEDDTSLEEYFDAYTLFRVRNALCRTGMNHERAENAINEMLNAGILFRERIAPRKESLSYSTVESAENPTI